ncbi:MAG TPA: family 2B encapsulin nanocompartment shell protein [Trebonia sp.]|jgi:CRP-like cAMP-binding protein|nr:family 2B encapsulin nanocompartment shell protein [Trebonia sp.]
MSIETDPAPASQNGQSPLSLSTSAARNLATTTKSVPQMQGITSRWLLRLLPWIEVSGGAYRVNRRLSYTVGDGQITFVATGDQVRVIPDELRELPALRDFDDHEVLSELAGRFEQHEFGAGEVIAEFGHQADRVYLIARGKINKVGTGKYGTASVLGVLADGQYFGDQVLTDSAGIWEFTAKAATACTVLSLPRPSFEALSGQSGALASHIESYRNRKTQPQNDHGEAEISVAAGHDGEPDLPGTFVDYESSPREYELSVAQTVLRVHSRVADLYNGPMDQVEQQLRLTIEALRERQEHEVLNNSDFGLLHNADFSHRIHTRSGPPTPDDMDELLATVWKEPSFFLAHPRAIAAFGRECSARGLYPASVDVGGHQIPAWRGIPMFPCGKIPLTDGHTSSILLMRTGEDKQGVIGLRQTGIPDEYEPGLNVRFMGVSEKGIISYLVSAYYSAAILVPDALGVLENVELGQPAD